LMQRIAIDLDIPLYNEEGRANWFFKTYVYNPVTSPYVDMRQQVVRGDPHRVQ